MIRRIALFGLTAGLALATTQAESARTSVARDFPVYDNGGQPDLTLDPQRFVAQMEIIGRRHYGKKAVPAGGGGGKSPTRELLDTNQLLLKVQKELVHHKKGLAL